MKRILEHDLGPAQAALWFLGQSGFVLRAAGKTVALDPYLTDAVAKVSPQLTREYPPPLEPEDLRVDFYIATHDHLDHLDPETLHRYRHKKTTTFIAPRFAADKLRDLGIPDGNIVKIDQGESQVLDGVEFTGIYTVPNEPDVIDTAGYRIRFPNARSIYHSSDTGLSPLLLACAPHAEVGLFCINGKWGNLSAEQAVELALRVKPRYAVPHHHDLMRLNSENPETFRYCLHYADPLIETVIPEVMQPFIWT